MKKETYLNSDLSVQAEIDFQELFC